MSELTQDDLCKILESGPKKVHLVGVAGSGMSGLAELLIQQGHQVSGSDLLEDASPSSSGRIGIHRFNGHSAAHIENQDIVSYSSAIPSDNVELQEAQRRGIPMARRARVLAAMARQKRQVVIAGTHGKSTTSAMIAHILRFAGKQPAFFIGAQIPDLKGNAEWGKGECFVIEADESDGTLAEFHPHDLVILNIEAEHMDFYRTPEDIERVFESLGQAATGRVIYCADDPGAVRVGSCLKPGPQIISYSLMEIGKPAKAEWQGKDVERRNDRTGFNVFHQGKCLGEVGLKIPGLQNVSNALAALATTAGLGVDFKTASSALGEFRGARRRFDVLFESDEFLLVDDYAHHPTEVRATIEAARQKGRKRLVTVFQPHRYSRVRALGPEFGGAFQGADRVLLTDIYAASELPMAGVDGKWVADAVVANMGADKVAYEPDLWRLKERAGSEIHPGDLLLVMGAGNIGQMSRSLAEELHFYEAIRRLLKPSSVIRRYEPMAKRTSMRAGGVARLWVEPSDEEDLSKILAYCHEQRQGLDPDHSSARTYRVTFVGRGSNLLVRDAGISGVTIHLAAPAFTGIRIEGEKIMAGAGARLKQVVMEARRENLGGLEFMEGIPGSVGGALWMNAGAMGGAIFNVVERVRMMDLSGHLVEKVPSELGVVYRSCPGMQGCVALSAVLKGKSCDRGEIDSRLKEFEAKRWASQPAASSAGCIFKNPPQISAGKLIDEMGLKNLRFGHARVSEVHANFIVNDGGATAGDILGLISLVKERVRRERGIELETEVMVIGEEERNAA